MLLCKGKDVFVRHVELSLFKINPTVGMVVFVESEQPVFAVMRDVRDEVGEAVRQLAVTLADVSNASGAEINLELQPVKRMSPSAHLRIDESIATSGSYSSDVRVVINQTCRIDVRIGALNKVR